MQNPAEEISEVVSLVTAAVNPDIQKVAVLRYYAPDVRFRHPLCSVSPGPGSRDLLLGILQWYRIMSPYLKIKVNDVTYNEPKQELFVDCVQEFHIRWSPLRAAPARLIVHLKLRRSDDDPSLFVIAEHEDFYHPEDLVALVVPPFVPIVRLLLKFGTLASNVNAAIFETLGYWNVTGESRGSTSDRVASTSREKSRED